MQDKWKAIGAAVLMLSLGAWSYFYFRANYAHSKRLRVVEEGKLYRCGQLTAEGFKEAVERLGIRTIVNVQDDYPDPDLLRSYLDRRRVKESAICKELGVNYVWIAPLLVDQAQKYTQRPVAIDQFLDLMDREESYPVLLHCKAGLHRTGLLSGIYRMEYQKWTLPDAYRELKRHGFGEWASTRNNAYVDQYMFRYKVRDSRVGARSQVAAVRNKP